MAWGEIDPIPPVGAVMTHTCGSWELRNGQVGPSPAVLSLAPTLVPI
ncbi:hypothetical protein T4B_8497, partial [Trichinella pseudospiralis]